MFSLLLILGMMTQVAPLEPWQIKVTKHQLANLHIDLRIPAAQSDPKKDSNGLADNEAVVSGATLGTMMFLSEELRKQVPEAVLAVDRESLIRTRGVNFQIPIDDTMRPGSVEMQAAAALMEILLKYSTQPDYLEIEYGEDEISVIPTSKGQKFFFNLSRLQVRLLKTS
jgi:hypothetical protein